jgi:poly-D-alanine transfer protein DltD
MPATQPQGPPDGKSTPGNPSEVERVDSTHPSEVERVDPTHPSEVERVDPTHPSEVKRVDPTHPSEVERVDPNALFFADRMLSGATTAIRT